MKTEKLYDFSIDRPLTPARRRAVEKQIEQNAHLSPQPISYRWEEEVLHITAAPVLIEVRFQKKSVELYGTAPLWARLLFTKQRKAELKDQIESVLHQTKFITAGKALKSASRKAQPAGKQKTRKAATPSRRRHSEGRG